MRHQVPVAVEQLAAMRPASRDEVFRASPPGGVPSGKADGVALLPLPAPLASATATLIRLLVWKGKVFDPARGDLRNRMTPLGIRAIRAKVYPGPSWLDGADCVVLDYSRTSLVARWIRDEIREVAPDTYLGLVFVRKAKLLHFVLSFTPAS
jgi:hypothetical protein